VTIYKPTYSKSNSHYTVLLRIIISQHSRDKLLINSLKETLGCGVIYEHSKDAVTLTISKFKDIYSKIIPLFNEHSIQGVKALDFQDFCKIAKLVNEKAHLTLAGSEKVREIKLNMNKGRYI
jgi:hypothetical protein